MAEPLTNSERVRRLRDEQRRQWLAGEPRMAETLLAAHPELAADSEACLDIIYSELCLREELGQSPSEEEYLQRFPDLATELQPLFDVHRALDNEALLQLSGEPTRDFAPHSPALPGSDAVANGRQRYRLVRLHKSGGLGHVYVAFDEELHRQVAVKQMQSGNADRPESRSRFLVEAEITGRLEHPGIVPVYGLGHDSQGRPFYAMRLIKGESLQAAIDRYHEAADRQDGSASAMQFRMLLRRLIDVCNAIAYAHSRGVLHRDLKPENIMLGPYGETLVVDWGLAKTFTLAGRTDDESEETLLKPSSGDGSAPTQTGLAVGTPHYMSPEQAAGWHEDLGPESDVYSLAATLYYLLTGGAPFRGVATEELLDHVRRGDFPPPRLVRREAPAALETVCLKGMALDPTQRYGTPRALAEDLERWLADEPVRAYQESWPQRLTRWGRRHRAWTRAVAAALVLVTLVSSVSAIVVRQKERRAQRLAQDNEQIAQREQSARQTAERERHLADAARQAAEAARQQAESAERQAQLSAEEARQQFTNAQEAANFLASLFHAADYTRLNEYGLRASRQKPEDLTARQLLDRGADELPKRFANQPELQAHLMNTLGNVYRSLGVYDRAEPLLEQALALRQEALSPSHADVAASLHNLAWLRHDMGEYKEAERLYRQALAMRVALFGPDDLSTATTKFNLAWLLGDVSQFDRQTGAESERLYREVIAARRKHLGDTHRDVAIAQAGLSRALFNKGASAEALVVIAQAMHNFEQLEETDSPLGIARLYFDAASLRTQRRYEESERLHRQVIERAKEYLGDEHPFVALLIGDLAGLLRVKGDTAEAEEAIREALDIGRRSPARGHPKMLAAMREFADALRDRGDVAEAESLYREGVELGRQRLGDDHPLVVELRQRLDGLLANTNTNEGASP